MPSKRSRRGASSKHRSNKKTKTEENAPAAAAPDCSDRPDRPDHTKTFSEGFWKGCKLDIYVPSQIITLTPDTGPQTLNPTPTPALFSTELSLKTSNFDKTAAWLNRFPFEETMVNCCLYVRSPCFGPDYSGIPHLLEHVLVHFFADYYPHVSMKANTTAQRTRYEFKLIDETDVETLIPEIVKAFTNVDEFTNKSSAYMPEHVHNVHNEYLERLFHLSNPNIFLAYLLGNKAYGHPGSHEQFCGACDGGEPGEKQYKKTLTRLWELFEQVYIPDNIYLLLESKNVDLVNSARTKFTEEFIKVRNKHIEIEQQCEKKSSEKDLIKELEYSLSGTWMKAEAAFIKSYRELNLAWTIKNTDLILYEFLATLFSCQFVKGGLVDVLKDKCPDIVYRVDDALIQNTSTTTRHFVLRISLFSNVTEDGVVKVTLAVLGFLKGLKEWITHDPELPNPFEAQFENFLLLMDANGEISASRGKEDWESRLDSVALNFAYKPDDPTLNIDKLAWMLAVPISDESMERLGKILDDEFINFTNMAIIDIELDKNQTLTLTVVYQDQLDQRPTEKFKNDLARKLKEEPAMDLKIDLKADFIKNPPADLDLIYKPGAVTNTNTNVPYLHWTQLMDPCIHLQLILDWCATTSHPHLHMPEMLGQFLSRGYSDSNYSVWLDFKTQGPGALTVNIVGLKVPAVDLLYQILDRLKHLKNNNYATANYGPLELQSTSLHVIQTLANNMSLNMATNLLEGMMQTNHRFYQDQLVGHNEQDTNKGFYEYFADVLSKKLHFALMYVTGNMDRPEAKRLSKYFQTVVGKKCVCQLVRALWRQKPISLRSGVFPNNKKTVVLRKLNYLPDSKLQIFQRVYYLNSDAFDCLNTEVAMRSKEHLEAVFSIYCLWRRIGYSPTVEISDSDSRLIIFKVPFSIDVRMESEPNVENTFHTMDTVRFAVEQFIAGFLEISKAAFSDQWYEQYANYIAKKVLPALKCRLTVELYDNENMDAGNSTVSDYSLIDDVQTDAHVIDWFEKWDISVDVPTLKKYIQESLKHVAP